MAYSNRNLSRSSAALVGVALIGSFGAADWPQFRGAQQQQRQPRHGPADAVDRERECRLEGRTAGPWSVEPNRHRQKSHRHLFERREARPHARSVLRRGHRRPSLGAAVLGHRSHAFSSQQRQRRSDTGQRRRANLRVLFVERSGLSRPRWQLEMAARTGLRFSTGRQ